MQGVARIGLIGKCWALELEFLPTLAAKCWQLDVHRGAEPAIKSASGTFSLDGSRSFLALTKGVPANDLRDARFEAIGKVDFSFELGLETPASFEYFLSPLGKSNDLFLGQLRIERSMPLGARLPWLATFIDSKFIPNAVLKNAPMPPEGTSALPSSLEKAIPPEFRYWTHKGQEAVRVRAALLASGFLNDHCVAPVIHQLRTIKRNFSLANESPIAADVSPHWPILKAASLLPSGSSFVEVFSPSIEEIRKMSDEGKHVVYVDAGEASPSSFSQLMKSLEAHAGDFVVTAIDSSIARGELAKMGRVFQFAPGAGVGVDAVDRIFVASFGVRGDDVRWIDKADADEEEFRRPRIYTEPPQDHTDLGKATWSTAYVNDLPDANFLYIEPGGEKDEEGKTKPRTLRHFPFKDKNGNVDELHTRNAIGRIPQSNAAGLSQDKKESLQDRARTLLERLHKSAEFNNPDAGGAGAPAPDPEIEKRLKHRSDGWHVMSEDGSKHLGGPYPTKGEAVDRLREVEGHKEKSDMRTGGAGTLQPSVPWDVAGQPKIRRPDMYKIEIEIVKAQKDDDEHYVLGIVLEPNTVDAQDDIYSADEVRAAAYKYMAEFQNRGLMHQQIINNKVDILENYIAPSDFTIDDQHVKKGTWLMAVRVKDPALWKQVKEGGLTGFSIGGSANRQPDPSADKKYKQRQEKAHHKTAFQGIPVTVDRPRGTVQEGVDKEGNPWSREYKTDYGFIPRTKGGDGEGLDVFLGPNGNSPLAYWITQRKDDGSFDEYKLVLGADSPIEAQKIYLDHVPQKYFGGIAEGSVHQIKALLNQEPEPKLAAA